MYPIFYLLKGGYTYLSPYMIMEVTWRFMGLGNYLKLGIYPYLKLG